MTSPYKRRNRRGFGTFAHSTAVLWSTGSHRCQRADFPRVRVVHLAAHHFTLQRRNVASPDHASGSRAGPHPVVLNSEILNYSKLAADRGLVHAAILDEFSTAGVEIMSPHYSALREGQSPTSPTTPTSPTSPLANQS